MNCPHCNANWQGEPMPITAPDEPQEYYGRQIGIDGGYMRIYDGLVAWECPDCSQYSPISGRECMFEKFIKLIPNSEK